MNGRLVKEWMEENGMRPEELAVKLGVGTGTINRMTSGRKVSTPTVKLVAILMGVQVEALLLPKDAKRAG